MGLLRRFGSALILIGVILMVVFLVSSTIDQGQAIWLMAGAVLSALGLYFRRAGSRGERRTGRFRIVRKWIRQPPEARDDD